MNSRKRQATLTSSRAELQVLTSSRTELQVLTSSRAELQVLDKWLTNNKYPLLSWKGQSNQTLAKYVRLVEEGIEYEPVTGIDHHLLGLYYSLRKIFTRQQPAMDVNACFERAAKLDYLPAALHLCRTCKRDNYRRNYVIYGERAVQLAHAQQEYNLSKEDQAALEYAYPDFSSSDLPRQLAFILYFRELYERGNSYFQKQITKYYWNNPDEEGLVFAVRHYGRTDIWWIIDGYQKKGEPTRRAIHLLLQIRRKDLNSTYQQFKDLYLENLQFYFYSHQTFFARWISLDVFSYVIRPYLDQ